LLSQDEVDARIRAGEAWRLTVGNLRALRDRRDALERDRQARQAEARGLLDALERLWERIREPEAARAAGRAAHGGLAPAALEALRAAVGEAEGRKRGMLRGLVGEAREALERVWGEMRLGPAGRRRFAPAFEEVFTEEALRLHEVLACVRLCACIRFFFLSGSVSRETGPSTEKGGG
jgi:hypothetical protein